MEWIDRYLNKELRGEELSAFEDKLRTDAGFLAEVELQRRLVLFLKEEGLRGTFRQLEKEYVRQPETPIVPLLRKRAPSYAVAAVIALLVVAGGIGYFLLNRGQAVFSSPELATITYQGDTEPPFPSMPSRGSTPQYVPVLIYPPAGEYTHHYQFADTLRLYGHFNTRQLTLSYQKKGDRYRLREDSLEYPLQRSTTIIPLTATPD